MPGIDISDKFEPSGGAGAFMLYNLADLDVEAPAAINISSDRIAITAGSAVVKAAAQSGTTDDIDGISGFNEGQFLIVRADTGDTLTIKDENAGAAADTDKIRTPGSQDVVIREDEAVLLYHDDTLDRWIVLAAPARPIQYVAVTVGDKDTNLATGDGQGFFHVPPHLGGRDLVYVHAEVYTAGTTNTLDVQINNDTQAADMLSTKLTVDSAETGSDTAATAAVIDTANDDVATNDRLEIDIDAVHTTPAKGLVVTMGFQ